MLAFACPGGHCKPPRPGQTPLSAVAGDDAAIDPERLLVNGWRPPRLEAAAGVATSLRFAHDWLRGLLKCFRSEAPSQPLNSPKRGRVAVKGS
jgi:hypothetical protein